MGTVLRAIVSVLTAACAAVVMAAQAPSSQAPPTFRAGTEIVHLDVSVFDKDRRPVRGLTAGDFTILEDGTPRPVVAFSAIDVPEAVPPTARWMREVPHDVSTNQLDGKRLVLIVFDDATVSGDLATLREAKRAAHRTIDELGRNDAGAIVFTLDNRLPQDFTTDKGRLRAAVDRINYGTPNVCDCGLCSIRTLRDAARSLQPVSMQRKLIVYISAGLAIDWTQGTRCGSPQLLWMRRTFQEALIGNVNIYAVDPAGLRVEGGLGGPVEYLQVMAGNTGGGTIINHNYPEQDVPRIFPENSSYYILAYELTGAKPEGDFFRRLEVKVNRPGVDVRSRNRYYGPQVRDADDEDVGDGGGAAGSRALERAVAGLLPARAVPMRVTAAPFAESSDPGKATVAMVLHVDQASLDSLPGPDGRRREHVRLLVHAFDPEGRPKGFQTQDATIVMRPGATGRAPFEVLTSTELPAGRYSLRLAAGSQEREAVGSVTIDVDVPKFDTTVSLSGALVTSSSSPIAAPREALARLVPFVPTAQRTFSRGDTVEVFLRAYQNSRPAMTPVEVTWRIRDGRDRQVWNERESLQRDRLAPGQPADLRKALPLAQLPPGDYLLTVEAVRGRVTARRDVRFTVQ
jgi:VWFA-related protein